MTAARRKTTRSPALVLMGTMLLGACLLFPPLSPPAGSDALITFEESDQDLGTADGFTCAVGDIDGDVDPDLLIVGGGAAPVRVWCNDGSGFFTDSGQGLGLDLNHGVALGDLDGDQDLDVFVVNNGDPDCVYLNTGDGTFVDSGQRLGLAGDYSCFVHLADLDHDGDLDAVVDRFLHPHAVWCNDGTGIFGPEAWVFGGDDSGGLALAHLDADPHLDLFLTSGDNPCEVWWGDGEGHFIDSGQRLGSAGGWRKVALGDLDGDQDIDAVAASASHGCQVFFNDGSGTFDQAGPFFGEPAQRLGLGDLDFDGDLDLCTTHMAHGNQVWVNDGSGAFEPAGTLLGDAPQLSVTLADLDRDQDLDVVLGGSAMYASPHRIYLNVTGASSVPGDWIPEEIPEEIPDGSPSAEGRPAISRCFIVAPSGLAGQGPTIDYDLTAAGIVRLDVLDGEGRLAATVLHQHQAAGPQSVRIPAERFGGGLWFFRLATGAGPPIRGRFLNLR